MILAALFINYKLTQVNCFCRCNNWWINWCICNANYISSDFCVSEKVSRLCLWYSYKTKLNQNHSYVRIMKIKTAVYTMLQISNHYL